MITLPLSVIILVKDRTPLLEKVLASVTFASEIIILDHGKNSWQDLQKHFPLKIIDRPQSVTNFAQERNLGLQQVKEEWVLFLDSDELLEETAFEKISAVMALPGVTGARLKRQDWFYGRPLQYGEAGFTHLLRLGKRSELAFTRPVHEVALIKSGTVIDTDILIQHYAHESISSFWNKISWYAQLEAEYRWFADPPTKLKLITQLLMYPWLKFLLNFVIKLGMIDGWRGLIYAIMMSCHSLMVRAYEYQFITRHEK